jgi:hypothetical protein
MTDTVRILGLENDLAVVQALDAQAIQDATPVLSSAINTASKNPDYRRTRILLVAHSKEVTPTSHTMAFTVTESATEGGAYTAATTTGTLTASADDSVTRVASIKRNKAKPWIKVTATGSHADVDVLVSAWVMFIKDAI